MSTETRSSWAGAVAIVVVAVLVNLPGLMDPAIFHDEALTIQLTAGTPEPVWPEQVQPAARVLSSAFDGSTNPKRLVEDLYRFDVHPPVYFLAVSAWRTIFGRSLEALRLLSVLALVMAGLVFRLVLRRAGHPSPDLTSLLLISLSGLVVVGQVARPYGMALCWLLLASWCLSVYADSPSWWHALGCAVFCSLAFLTSYLALFPLVAILGGFVATAWPASRVRAAVVPGLVGLSWLPWLGFIARQSSSRPGQEAGFAGWPTQLIELWRAHETLLWVAYHPARQTGVAVLFSLGLLAWFRFRRPEDRALSWLLLAWAILPTAGVLALNLAFDKHLGSARYFVLAGPGIAGLLGYALSLLPRAWIACGLFVGLQIVAILRFDAEGTSPSVLAAKMAEEGLESTVVLVGSDGGFGGFPGQVAYELDEDVPVLILDDDEDLAKLQAHVAPYQQVWLLAPPLHVTRGLEGRAFQQLLESGSFRVVQANEAACRLRRTAREPAGNAVLQ